MDLGRRQRHRHHLVVSEIDIVVAAEDEVRCWEIDLILDDTPYQHNLLIIDPFNNDAAASCKWYLEKYAAESPLERRKAETIERSLQAYARQLFDQLKLHQFAESKSQSETPGTLIIDVVDAPRPLKLSITSIHRLHWETLESESLWPKLFEKVIVRRRTAHEWRAKTVELQLDSLDLTAKKKSTFNVLVVMARNVSGDGSKYQDVDPFLGLRTLIAVRKTLIDARANVLLEIEVVRPGTFKAFRKHLEISLLEKGPAHFDLIHFDLHGRVAVQKSDKQKVAWLLFKTPNGGTTLQAIPAATVVECLEAHHTKLAVFNSCNSATSNAGLNANLAGLLAANGIPGVLAMSFKLLNTAATSFLSSFYQELFLRRTSFGEAVATARGFLRQQPERGARFGLRVAVRDWIIPVAYINGEDVSVFSDAPNSILGGLEPTVSLRTVSPLIAQDRLVGRDLDILCLEDTLIDRKVLHLAGPPGIGKSALIAEIARTWTETAFATQVVLVSQPAETFRDFLAIMKSSLPSTTQEADDVESPSTEELQADILIRQICSTSTILLLDHMNYLKFCDFASKLPTTYLKSLANFFYELLRRNVENPRSKHLYMVFVGYDTHAHNEWWTNHFGLLNAFPITLPTLDLPSSLTFADMVLEQAGGNGSWRKVAEIDGLVQLIELLQRNPLALRIVLPAAVRGATSMTAFYLEILTGEGCLDELLTERDIVLYESHMITTLVRALEVMRNTERIEWFCAMGLFWHQGPNHILEFTNRLVATFDQLPKSDTEERLTRFGPSLNLRALSFMVLNEAHAFRCDATALEWIHPLCTIMLRKLYRERLSTHVPEWVRALHVCFLVGMDERIIEQYPEELWKIPEDRKTELAESLQIQLPNILFAMHVCSKVSLAIDLDQWPLSLATAFSLAPRWPVAKKLQLQPLLGKLIERFIAVNGGLSVQQKHQYFVLSAIVLLVDLTNISSNDMSHRRTELCFDALKFAMEIMESSEDLSSPGEPDIPLQIVKSALYLECSMMCLTRGLTEMADTAWQQHHRINKDTVILPEQDAEELLDGMLGDLSPTKINMGVCAAQVCTLVRGLADNVVAEKGGLPFKKGDLIIIVGPHRTGWYEGVSNGRLGVFEADQVEPLGVPSEQEVNLHYGDFEKALFMTPLNARTISKHHPDVQYKARKILEAGDNIYLLSPLRSETWTAWFYGDLFEVDISDMEVQPHTLDIFQPDRLADETLDVLELGVAWEWVRVRMMSLESDDTVSVFPLPAMEKYLSLRYNRLYRNYLKDDCQKQYAFLRGLHSDRRLCLAITELFEEEGAADGDLSSLERATESGQWSIARIHHDRLRQRAAREENRAAHVYHIKKLLELYEGVKGSEDKIRRLKFEERITRLLACEAYVSSADTSWMKSDVIEALKHGLEGAEAWSARLIQRVQDGESSRDEMQKHEMREAWMDAGGPAASFNIGLDFREGV